LYLHFDRHEVAPTLYAAPWILTLFASQFPLGFVTRVFGKCYFLDVWNSFLKHLWWSCEVVGMGF
jgi:hypothetical protein